MGRYTVRFATKPTKEHERVSMDYSVLLPDLPDSVVMDGFFLRLLGKTVFASREKSTFPAPPPHKSSFSIFVFFRGFIGTTADD
jgi:hypothetical protein